MTGNILYRPRSRFTQVPNEIIFDKNLTAQAKGVAAYLFSRPIGWRFYEAEITSHFSNGREGIRSALKNLIDVGYLRIRRVRNEKGQLIGCAYSVRESLSEPFVDVVDVESATIGKATSGKSDTNNTDNNNTEFNKTPHTPQGAVANRDGVCGVNADNEIFTLSAEGADNSLSPHSPAAPLSKEEGFEDFWSAYPKCERKQGKAKCLELWKKYNLCNVCLHVMAALENDKKSSQWTKDNGKYIPGPAVWLNKKRWLDDDAANVVAKTEKKYAIITIEDYDDPARVAEWSEWRTNRKNPPPAWSIKTAKEAKFLTIDESFEL